jgi:hypothetical protein
MFKELTLAEKAILRDDISNGLLVGESAKFIAKQSFVCGCFAFRKRANNGPINITMLHASDIRIIFHGDIDHQIGLDPAM